MRSALYAGHLEHARHDDQVRHAFRYPLYLACLDLDELPALVARLRLFSHNRFNLFSLHDRDVRALPHAAAPPAVTTRLVTQLRVAHYVFNPVSFLLDYDRSGAITGAVAEVNNNYGGNHAYVLGPQERIPDARNRVAYRTSKQFFVSPFIHGPATYDFAFAAPLDGPHLELAMRVARPDADAPFFVARFRGERVELTDRALLATAARYPLMTLQVIGLIYWEAVKLHLRGVAYRRPGPDHRPTDPPAPTGRTDRGAR
jgi:DUF1365 family protein